MIEAIIGGSPDSPPESTPELGNQASPNSESTAMVGDIPSLGTDQTLGVASATPSSEGAAAPSTLESPEDSTAGRVAELEAALNEVPFRIDAPAEDWDVAAKLAAFREANPLYYDRMGWEIISQHLPQVLPLFLEDPNGLPSDLQPMVERMGESILTRWTGLSPEQIGQAISQYRNNYAAPAPSAQSAGGEGVVEQYGLDPYNPQHQALIQQLNANEQRMNALQARLDGFGENVERAKADEGVRAFQGTIDAYKNSLLDKVPVPAGYDYLKAEIAQVAQLAFDNDPIAKAAMEKARAFYAQGTPGLQAAAGEIAKVQHQLSTHIKNVSEQKLKPIVELEQMKAAATQKQQQTINFPPNSGGSPNPASPRSSERITPMNAGEIAAARWRARNGGGN